MSIKNVLIELKRLANDNGLSEPYIVGGLPRDKVLGREREIEDVDLTTGDDSIGTLAEVTANKFKVTPMRLPDGHYQMHIDNIKYDFSTNFNSKDAKYFLNKAGLMNPTEMQLELFSRDFTCNTLIAPMSLRKIVDPTGIGLEDIKNKILKTPLPPRITLRDDTNRVPRAIYMAAKLGFEVEADIIKWVRDHHEKIAEEVSDGFSRKKLAAAARADMDKTIKLLTAMNLWKVISIPNIIKDELALRGLR